MYSVKSYDIKAFITDTRVRLPRFQRKKTWNEIDNFKLCISLFKDYPIGVCIVSTETNAGRTIKFLLDGRQRREALTLLNNDPENLYKWAMKFIKFRKSDSDEEVTDKFYEVISEFLEEENDTVVVDPTDSAASGDDVEEVYFEGDDYEDTEQPVEAAAVSDGLDLLLRLILKTHHWNKKGSGFTLPFDFTKFVVTLPYVDMGDNGNYTLSSRALKSFISSYREFCKEKYYDEPDIYKELETFWTYVKKIINILPGKEVKLKEHISRHWGAMLERIELLQKLDEKLSTNEIGVIEVNDMQSYDYQKIFNLINTQGADLKAVEILSAKPKWNVKITNPSEDFELEAKKLYKVLGTSPECFVKWDMPATFISRLKDNFFFKKYTDSTTDFEAKITAGFVVLSGLFQGAVNKDAFDKLGSNPNIRWSSEIDALVSNIARMSSVMSSYSYFNFLKSWNCNVHFLTSDYVAYNFFILCYLNWKEKGFPSGSDSVSKKFQKECFFLLDRLIYEYVTGVWKGSGDSRIKNNIDNLASNFTPVPEQDWVDLLNNIFDNGMINDTDIKFDTMKTLLYHFYCLNEQRGPNHADGQLDVDHIIPQALFNNSTFDRVETLRDNLLNLGILPKKENCSKGKKRLVEITDSWLKSEVKEYEFIDEADYQTFSNVNNYLTMFNQRRPIFINAFTVMRRNLLNN